MTIWWRICEWLAFLLQPVMVTLAIIVAARRKTLAWVLLAAACVSHMCLYNTRFVAASLSFALRTEIKRNFRISRHGHMIRPECFISYSCS